MSQTAEADQGCASPIRVFLVDEEVVVRAGMRILIDSWPISKVVGEADSVEQALRAMEAIKPDLIVFSHDGHSGEFLADLGHLTAAAGQTPLVFLTRSRDPKMGAIALKAGAKWIALKQDEASELRDAIQKAHSGEVWVNRASFRMRLAQHNHDHNGRRPKPDSDGSLTNREREVALLVSRGCTNRQIGLRLGITEITVRHHLSSIFNKVGVTNRFELISWIYRRGAAKMAVAGTER